MQKYSAFKWGGRASPPDSYQELYPWIY